MGVVGGLMLDDLANRIDNMSRLTVKAGVFSRHFYPAVDEDGNETGGARLAEVVVTQEFGDPNKKIPARPFMRPALKVSKTLMAGEAIKQLNDGKDAEQVAAYLGAYLVGAIRKQIRDLHTPVLRPLTIQKRLERGVTSIKPLIDSGYMLASMTFEVSSD